MVQATSLPRNEAGIETVLGLLKQQFSDQLHTGEAMRQQHGHTATWIETQSYA